MPVDADALNDDLLMVKELVQLPRRSKRKLETSLARDIITPRDNTEIT